MTTSLNSTAFRLSDDALRRIRSRADSVLATTGTGWRVNAYRRATEHLDDLEKRALASGEVGDDLEDVAWAARSAVTEVLPSTPPDATPHVAEDDGSLRARHLGLTVLGISVADSCGLIHELLGGVTDAERGIWVDLDAHELRVRSSADADDTPYLAAAELCRAKRLLDLEVARLHDLVLDWVEAGLYGAYERGGRNGREPEPLLSTITS